MAAAETEAKPPVAEPATEPKAQNLVYSAKLHRKVNIRLAAEILLGHYDPNRFPSCGVRNREPRAAVGIDGNGNVVVVGAKSYDVALHVLFIQLSKLALRTHDFSYVRFSNFRLRNMVASFNIGFEVNLKLMWQDHQEKAAFSAENIGAFHLWPKGMYTRLVLVVWATGKAHVSGATTTDEVMFVYKYVDFAKYKLGAEYRSLDSAVPSDSKEQETKQKAINAAAASAATVDDDNFQKTCVVDKYDLRGGNWFFYLTSNTYDTFRRIPYIVWDGMWTVTMPMETMFYVGAARGPATVEGLQKLRYQISYKPPAKPNRQQEQEEEMEIEVLAEGTLDVLKRE